MAHKKPALAAVRMSVHFLEDDHGHHSDQEHVEEVEEDGMDHQFSLSWLGHQLDWVHPSDIPHHVKDVQERLHKSIVRQWRQAITGDPDRYVVLGSDRYKITFYLYFLASRYAVNIY